MAVVHGARSLEFFKLSGQVGGKGQVEGGISLFSFSTSSLPLAFGFRAVDFWTTITNSFGP